MRRSDDRTVWGLAIVIGLPLAILALGIVAWLIALAVLAGAL